MYDSHLLVLWAGSCVLKMSESLDGKKTCFGGVDVPLTAVPEVDLETEDEDEDLGGDAYSSSLRWKKYDGITIGDGPTTLLTYIHLVHNIVKLNQEDQTLPRMNSDKQVPPIVTCVTHLHCAS